MRIFVYLTIVYLTLYFPKNGCLPPVISMSSALSRQQRTGLPVLKNTNTFLKLLIRPEDQL